MPSYLVTPIPGSSTSHGQGYATESDFVVWEGSGQDWDGNGPFNQIFFYDIRDGTLERTYGGDSSTSLTQDPRRSGFIPFMQTDGFDHYHSMLYGRFPHKRVVSMNERAMWATINSRNHVCYVHEGGGGFGNRIFVRKDYVTLGEDSSYLHIVGDYDSSKSQYVRVVETNREQVMWVHDCRWNGWWFINRWEQDHINPLLAVHTSQVSPNYIPNYMANPSGAVYFIDPSSVEPILFTGAWTGASSFEKIPPFPDGYTMLAVFNDLVQIIYSTQTSCFSSFVGLYQGFPKKHILVCDADITGKEFNDGPDINNRAEIVFSTSNFDHVSDNTVYRKNWDVWYSVNGEAPERIASPGMAPTIDDSGRVVYWDPVANQLVLLTPTSDFAPRTLPLPGRELLPGSGRTRPWIRDFVRRREVDKEYLRSIPIRTS